MNPGRSRYHLRERRLPQRRLPQQRLRSHAPSQELDHEDSPTNRNGPVIMDSWIVNLLLEYSESENRPEAQFGQVLKVLNEGSGSCQDGQDSEAVVHISDGRHYIRTVVPPRAIQTAKCLQPRSGFSGILGQFIILQNFRVCLKEAAKVEDSGFYLILDCFGVVTMKRWGRRQRDCNREPSVLQKIKELWLRGLALQPLPSSEPSSVSEVLREMKQDKLSALKQSVEDCLSSFVPGNLLDSEQLAAYPDTKWQAERKQDKIQHRDVFTVPAKFLVIDAEAEAAHSKALPPKPSHAASDSESSSDDDPSTVSFISGAETVDGSLENPWDVFPGMTLTSSKEMSDTQPSLPNAQQVLLASTPEEEEAASSSSCTPDGLQPCDPVPHHSSAQVESMETTSPSLLPPCKEGADQEHRSEVLNSAQNTSKIAVTDESIPCGQPLNHSNPHDCVPSLSPVFPTIRSTFLPRTSSGDMEENHPTHLQKEMVVVGGAGKKSLEKCRKCGTVKRKQLMPDEEESIEFSSRCKAQDLTSATVVPESSRFGKQVARKQPLEFVRESTPKKSRIEEIHDQQLQASAQSRWAGRHFEKPKEQTSSAGRPADSRRDQLGPQQQERGRRAVSHHVYPPATAELCSQVRSTRVSRALLGWARWVFRNSQRP